ncbi:hypothetical protein CMI37_01645 [Candidatus Pacearchaeota archaeon]|nr:hypothetical protein [Candidatus Pacearchaeota archaeon]
MWIWGTDPGEAVRLTARWQRILHIALHVSEKTLLLLLRREWGNVVKITGWWLATDEVPTYVLESLVYRSGYARVRRRTRGGALSDAPVIWRWWQW